MLDTIPLKGIFSTWVGQIKYITNPYDANKCFIQVQTQVSNKQDCLEWMLVVTSLPSPVLVCKLVLLMNITAGILLT
jgi:hypothetical protein